MGKHRIRILGTTTLVALVVGTTQAVAGGFAVREQSAWGEGSSYAGVAAGGSVSAMFWNPATTTQTGKFALEASASVLFPESTQTGTNNLPAVLGINDGIPNSAIAAIVPSSYTAMQLNDRLWLGFSLNSPFGLSVGFQNPNWAGAFYGQSSTVKSYNASPSVAYKIADWISVGVGFQAQYAQVNLKDGAGFMAPPIPATVNLVQLTGDGWGFGWTAGVTLTPTPWTQIGVGYRSAIDQSLGGSFTTNGVGAPATPGPAGTTVKLPDSASLGVRQRVNNQLTLLGTVEWTGWKRIGTVTFTQPNGQAVLAPPFGTPVTIPFQYQDGWFYSLGVEYVAAPAWTFRGGVGFEKSPITDQVRVPLLPDNDRTWYSVGATNKLTNIISVDLAYSFVDVKNTPLNVVAGNPSFNGLVTYTGTAKSSISIFSVGVKFKLDDPPPAVATRG
jgi:long-chain fatty acid transport protein